MFALVDCNNFYASCERVFNPSLIGKPVVVLSNNDGCVIARSQEAKDIGIGMAVPAHQIEHLVKAHNVTVFSSNYQLYGDLSERVMETLSGFAPEFEVYSIDEAFLRLSGMELYDLKQFGTKIVRTVTKNVGLPVSMGIAPTKTLAKLANRFAKKVKAYKGVCLIDTEEKRIKALQLSDVADIWGIGRQIAKKLEKIGVKTAYEFTQLPRAWVRKNMTVVGERTWCELRGEPCIEMETVPPDKKQICTSRSFGKMVDDLPTISEAVATYAAICARKLRKQKSCAVSLMVFIHTNNFREDLPQYFRNSVVHLPVATSSSIEIVHYAVQELEQIYKSGFQYKKAGVIIMEITPETAVQGNLFDKVDREKHKRLMSAADKLTDRYGKDKLKLASQGDGKRWKLRQEKLSPNYTTDIKDIIQVKL